MGMYYTLDENKNPVEISKDEWSQAYARIRDRQVADTKILNVTISTIFLGYSYKWPGDIERLPIVFETMIFGGDNDQWCVRTPTWAEAEGTHKIAVAMVMREAYAKQVLALIDKEMGADDELVQVPKDNPRA